MLDTQFTTFFLDLEEVCGVCEKISVSWIFYDNLLDFRIFMDFSGSHVPSVAI